MSALDNIVWGGAGAGLAFYSNALRKLPPMRRPWEHVMLAGIGILVGGYARDFKATHREGLKADLAKRDAAERLRAERIAAKK